MTVHDEYHGDEGAVLVDCHSYTHARRYPLVIGKIGGFALPTPLSPSQIVTCLGSFLLLLVTRGWWGMFTSGALNVLVMFVVSGVLTWAVRHLRMEGRSPIKMLKGLVTLAAAPRCGTVRGRQVWSQQRARRIHESIYVTVDCQFVGSSSRVDSKLALLVDDRPRWSCLGEEAL